VEARPFPRCYARPGECTRCSGSGRRTVGTRFLAPGKRYNTSPALTASAGLAPSMVNAWLTAPCSPCSGTGSRAEQLAYDQAMADVQRSLEQLEGPTPEPTPDLPEVVAWDALPPPAAPGRLARALRRLVGALLGRLFGRPL
jgi:hypothetical protein